jgi:hypothetical protein
MHLLWALAKVRFSYERENFRSGHRVEQNCEADEVPVHDILQLIVIGIDSVVSTITVRCLTTCTARGEVFKKKELCDWSGAKRHPLFTLP